MVHILACRSGSTKLRNSPFTETPIEGMHSVVYRAGVTPVLNSGADEAEGLAGTYARGVHRISGSVFSLDGHAAEALLGITDAIDLIIRYRASGQPRKRTLLDVVFVGDATVVFPPLNRGVPELIGVPFRVQIPSGDTLADHVIDEEDL